MTGSQKTRRCSLIARILALLVVIALSLFIFSIRHRAEQLGVYGYPGIFLVAFLAYATVILPAPGIAIVFTMGAVFHPLGVALAAGAGAALGEVTGYLTGFSGQPVVERVEHYERLSRWINKNGGLTILLMAAIPNPFFDLVGIIAGALKMSLGKFLLFCWLGETIKMCIFAYLGSNVLNWLL